MNTCAEFQRKIIDYVEKQLTEQEYKRFYEHLQHCKQCQGEYIAVEKLYEILDTDEVILPEKKFFVNLRSHVKQDKLRIRWFTVPKIIKIFVPVFAAVAILLLLDRPDKTVEITIPTSALLEDEEIAHLGLSGVIDDELIHELSIVERYLPFEIDETIDELTEKEQSILIKNLSKKYGNGI